MFCANCQILIKLPEFNLKIPGFKPWDLWFSSVPPSRFWNIISKEINAAFSKPRITFAVLPESVLSTLLLDKLYKC